MCFHSFVILVFNIGLKWCHRNSNGILLGYEWHYFTHPLAIMANWEISDCVMEIYSILYAIHKSDVLETNSHCVWLPKGRVFMMMKLWWSYWIPYVGRFGMDVVLDTFPSICFTHNPETMVHAADEDEAVSLGPYTCGCLRSGLGGWH